MFTGRAHGRGGTCRRKPETETPWVEHYTPKSIRRTRGGYQTLQGRDEVRDWIRETMTTFPGSSPSGVTP